MHIMEQKRRPCGPPDSNFHTGVFVKMADVVIKITCPVCGKEFNKKAKELKDGTVIQCPKCGEKTTIRGNMFTEMSENLEKNG